MSERLNQLIDAYKTTFKEWMATGTEEDITCDSEQYTRFDEAEFELIAHPCGGEEEARAKVSFIRQSRELMDTLANDRAPDGRRYLAVFMETLWPVDKSNNGEN